MRMVKACVGGTKGSNRCFVVAVHLGGLAWGTAPRPLANIFSQAIPSETFHDEANGGSYAWMGETEKIFLRRVTGTTGLGTPVDLNVVIKG